ncbi:MAG: DUF971 domain-containing protein [Planctomycetota bacterium]|jgi:DUF971 family protein
MEEPRPLKITKSDPTRLAIEWSDGRESVWSAVELRNACPCAHCVDEHTGVQRYDASRTPADLTTTDVRLMGHYALAIEFSDRHVTGIFPFRMLHQLAQASADGPLPRGTELP